MSLLATFFSTLLLVPLINGVPLLPQDPEFFDGSNLIRETTNATYRLPDHAVPFSYTIKLSPYLVENNFTFDGESSISIKITKKNDTIYLHARNLTVDKPVNLISSATGAKNQSSDDIKIDNVNDFLIIKFNESIEIGNWTLSLKYKGSLINNQLRGFYRSSYVNVFGEKEWMASTHFEPVGARLAFPCWDEPAIKATYKISIKHDERFVAISNMKISSIVGIDDSEERWTHFGETPPMSSYLVAFVVANFDSVSNNDNKMFKVWARKNAIHHGKYAAAIGYEALKALEDYTSITYKESGFTKIDSVAVPELSAGAMENWGLVIYRESGLLVEENVTSTSNIESVTKVISHELAHQWFGNLVSPQWWNYIWLSEGFANYFQYFITDKMPNQAWHLMDRYVVEILQASAFIADGVNTSHPMNVDVQTPNEIGSIFDSITYSKAGSVIRMFSYILGEKNFQTRLQNYLKNKKYSSATSDDLINELAAKDATLIEAFKHWVSKPGYPVLNVVRNYTTEKATLTQARFLYNRNETSTEKYWIPINYATGADLNFNFTEMKWMKPTDAMEIAGLKNTTWVIFNKQQFGYYRVNYDEKNWKLISDFLRTNHSQIHVLNRAQLIDDALSLAQTGQLFYNISLPLLQYLKQETNYIPWLSAWRGISYLNKMLANTDNANIFKDYVLTFTDNLIQHVKFNESSNDEYLQKLHRITVIEKTCLLGSQECQDYAFEQLKKWIKNSKENPLSSDLKKVILCGGVRRADKDTWAGLLKKFKDEHDNDLLTALGCTSNTAILNNYLLIAFNETELSANVRDTVFKAVYTGSDEGVNVALDFIINHAQKITGGNATKHEIIKKYVTEIGERVTNKDQLEKIQMIPGHINVTEDIIASGRNNALKNMEWLDLRMGEIQHYLTVEKNKPDSASLFTLSTILLTVSLIFSLLY